MSALFRFAEHADVQAIARAFGLNPFDLRDEAQQVEPSPVQARFLWRRVVDEADRVEKLLGSIYYKLGVLKDWERRGYGRPGAADDGAEWWAMRAKAAAVLLRRHGFLDETYEDGAGI